MIMFVRGARRHWGFADDSERESNPHGCDLRLYRASWQCQERNHRSMWDVMCPRGESPLTYMLAITGRLILGGRGDQASGLLNQMYDGQVRGGTGIVKV
jgi:hypothetical protein